MYCKVNEGIKNKQLSVLFDTSFAFNQASFEFNQQCAELFSALAKKEDVHLQGFLYAKENDIFFCPKETNVRSEAIEYAHNFFHDAFGHEQVYVTKLLSALNLKKLFKRTKKSYDLYAIDSEYREVIWRNVFDRYLLVEDRDSVLKKNFYYTDLNLEFQKKALLNSHCDFVIFPKASPMKVAEHSKKIIYLQSAPTKEQLIDCHLNSYFVCANEYIQKKIVEIFTFMEEKSCVIFPPFSSPYKKEQDLVTLNQIIQNRMVRDCDRRDQFVSEYVLAKSNNNEFLGWLSEALFKGQKQQPIHLLILGDEISPEINAKLEGYIKKDQIFVLKNIPRNELAYLFGSAKLFFYPEIVTADSSFKDAMHFECPIIANDYHENRITMQNSAYYCDLNDVEAIQRVFAELISSAAESGLAELRLKGKEKITLLSSNVIASQWLTLLENLKT